MTSNENTEERTPSMSVWWRLRVPAVCLGVIALWYCWPLIFSWIHFRQDSCSFGHVSNAQYRAYLAEAKELTKTKWPKLRYSVPSGLHMAVLREPMFARLKEFTANSSTVDETVARTHAVMRASGGWYRRTIKTGPVSTYAGKKEDYANLAYSYFFNIQTFGIYNPLAIKFVVFPRINSERNELIRSNFLLIHYLDNRPVIKQDTEGYCPKY